MNKTQAQKIEQLKARLIKHADLMLDQPMTFKTETIGNKVFLFGSNLENCTQWHHSHRMFIATVGLRGGVSIDAATDKLYRDI